MGSMMVDKQDVQLCNFVPCIESLIEIRTGVEKKDMQVQMRLDFEDAEPSKSFVFKLNELDKVQWNNIDNRCWFNPDIAKTKVQRYLEHNVRTKLNSAPRKEVYQLSKMGVTKIEGEVVFCAGQEVIKPPGAASLQVQVDLEQIDESLDIDTDISEGQAVSEVFKLVSLSLNPGRVILIYKIIYLMRHAYLEAGIKPNFCIYLYGKTGTKKTTFSSFLTQMYNRGKGIANPPRLNASIPAAVKILTDIVDDVIVLDDLCPAESNQIRKQQEETLIEITRYIGDGTVPARVKGKELISDEPKCGVIFTGEYVIGSGSDAARLLPVEMMPPDGEKLKYFQDRPLLVSTFYYFYIVWFIENYEEIVGLLKKWLSCYRKCDFGVHTRLQETHFFLNTAFAMLMQYCDEKKFLSHEDANRLHSSFRNLLMTLVQQQDRRVRQKEFLVSKEQNYWERIRELYKSSQFLIASNEKEFDIKMHDGLLYKNKFYVRGSKLSAYFPETDIREIVDSLAEQGVLEMGKGGRTKQIGRLNGMRFYVIPCTKLS